MSVTTDFNISVLGLVSNRKDASTCTYGLTETLHLNCASTSLLSLMWLLVSDGTPLSTSTVLWQRQSRRSLSITRSAGWWVRQSVTNIRIFLREYVIFKYEYKFSWLRIYSYIRILDDEYLNIVTFKHDQIFS